MFTNITAILIIGYGHEFINSDIKAFPVLWFILVWLVSDFYSPVNEIYMNYFCGNNEEKLCIVSCNVFSHENDVTVVMSHS